MVEQGSALPGSPQYSNDRRGGWCCTLEQRRAKRIHVVQRLSDQTGFVVNDDEGQGERDLHGALCKGMVTLVLTSLSLVPSSISLVLSII